MSQTSKSNNNIFIFSIIAIVLIIGGIAVFSSVSSQQNDSVVVDSNSTKDSMEVISSKAQDPLVSSSEATLAANYVDYSPGLLADSQAENKVLFFKASWCPTCTILDKNLQEETANIPNDTLILQVDYDSNQDLRQKYGVVSQHTLVQVDQNGEEIQKWSGSRNLASILSELN
jgi:thiol:disulfide interchange protein